MPLSLPPIRLIKYDEVTIKFVYDQLTSVIAGHPQAVQTYTFYEEIDNWLGPWGDTGYPIGYGKFYNIVFTSNESLMADPVTKDWVWKTTILLQELLRDYVVHRMRDKTLGSITEAEFREAAFQSHPKAYTEGGLAKVVMVAPGLLPIIALLPAKEYAPSSPNFKATVKQFLFTIGAVAPRATGYGLAALAGPAHTGIFQIAAHKDEQSRLLELRLGSRLAMLKEAIDRGDVDDIPTLRSLVDRLNAQEFPDQGFAHEARGIIVAANRRQTFLQTYYRNLLKQSPEVRKRIEDRFPTLFIPPAR